MPSEGSPLLEPVSDRPRILSHTQFFAGWVMGLQFLINLPALISNAAGSAAYSVEENLNFPRNFVAALSLGNHPAGESVTVHSIVDFVSSLAFVIFICIFRKNQVKKAREMSVAHITAADYSVHVSGLPPTATDTEELASFFAKYGEVAHVAISVENEREVKLDQRRSELSVQLESLDLTEFDQRTVRKEKVELQQQIDKIDEELEGGGDKIFPCTGHAFVTFMLESSAMKCIEEYGGKRSLLGLVRKKQTSYGLLFRGQFEIDISRAPQPSDIVWENLRFDTWSRIRRQILTTLISFVLVLFATGLIAAVNGKHWIFPVSHVEVFETIGLNIVSVVVILGANIFLFVSVPKLADFEKSHFQSNAEVVVMLRLLSFQVLNTVLASLILWDASVGGEGKPNWLHWFADGGYFLLNVMIGDAVLMNGIEYFRPFDVLLPRKHLAKKAKTQAELDALYSPPLFSLGMRYQFVLKAVFVSMFFGASMPLLYLLGAILLCFAYWIDKYNVLRVFKKPPTYDESVATATTVLILPLSVVFHLVVALFFYTVVVECPYQTICAPSQRLFLPFFLLSIDLAVIFGVWHPLLLKSPDVTLEMVRAREVPYNCVGNIDRYDAPDFLLHRREKKHE